MAILGWKAQIKINLLPDAHWDIEVESRLINLRCQVGVGFSFNAEI
jgi:hypothetical protein